MAELKAMATGFNSTTVQLIPCKVLYESYAVLRFNSTTVQLIPRRINGKLTI